MQTKLPNEGSLLPEEIKFIYRIQHPCRQQIILTTDPDIAERYSRNGYIVNTPPRQKVYKYSHNYQHGDGKK